MRRAFVGVGVLFMATVMFAVVALSAREAGPEQVIQKTIDEAFAVLRDKSLEGVARRSERISKLRAIADRTFNWAEMARGSVGAQWRGMDQQQRGRFVDVFKDILASQYMDDIDRFQGTEVVTVDSSAREGDDVVVKTTLVTSSREHVPIDYRMQAGRGTWSVVDISIEGVSMVNHFRKTFSNALTNMSIDQLIGRLKSQLPERH